MSDDFDRTDVSPEEFILDILWGYYIEHESIEKLAKYWDVSSVLVSRILTQYGNRYVAYSNDLEKVMKKSNQKGGLGVAELDEEVRKIGGAITQEDMDNLAIDLGIFGKGRDSGNLNDQEKDR